MNMLSLRCVSAGYTKHIAVIDMSQNDKVINQNMSSINALITESSHDTNFVVTCGTLLPPPLVTNFYIISMLGVCPCLITNSYSRTVFMFQQELLCYMSKRLFLKMLNKAYRFEDKSLAMNQYVLWLCVWNKKQHTFHVTGPSMYEWYHNNIAMAMLDNLKKLKII